MSFHTDSGKLARDTMTADSNGVVRTLWYRRHGASDVGIVAEIHSPSGIDLEYITLKPRNERLVLDTPRPASFTLYPNATSGYMVVGIKRDSSRGEISDSLTCVKQKVVFTPEGAGAKAQPDTAVGRYLVDPEAGPGTARGRCEAWSRWSVGSQVGSHDLRVAGVNTDAFRYERGAQHSEAFVQSLPHFILAGVNAWHGKYYAPHPQTGKTIRVDVTTATGKISYDSVITPMSIDTVTSALTAMGGVEIPIPLGGWWRKVVLAVGANINNPRASQYLGFSPIAAFIRNAPRDFPIDVLVVGERLRADALRNPGACASGTAPDPCITDKKTFWGAGISVTLDATTVFADAIKKLGN